MSDVTRGNGKKEDEGYPRLAPDDARRLVFLSCGGNQSRRS